MRGAAASILLCFLSSQVNALVTSAATCISGFDWTFSSINQSPCDVAEELLSVCFGFYPLPPLPFGYGYSGPYQGYINSCSCSSVVYSLLSACAVCQSRTLHLWSEYSANCTTVSVAEFTPEIPEGVKVPAYAYQNVSASDTFDSTLAQRMRGPDSTRLPSSTKLAYYFVSSGIPIAPDYDSSSDRGRRRTGIIGGVVGGVVGIGLIVTLIIVLRRLRHKRIINSNLQSPGMDVIPNAPSTIFPAGPPAQADNANDQNTYHHLQQQQQPSAPLDQNRYSYYDYDSQRRLSQPMQQNVPGFPGGAAHNYVHRFPDGRLNYSGMPEL